MTQTKRHIAVFLGVAAMVLGSAGCHPENDPNPFGGPGAQANPDGGAAGDDGGSPVVCSDPCQGDLILFGPETFTRGHCAPTDELRSFSLAQDADICVQVENLGNASARVEIDGTWVVRPSDFNPHVTDVIRVYSLGAGDHELRVRVASIPGTSVEVTLRACDPSAPPVTLCSTLAIAQCEDRGWVVETVETERGVVVCTVDGRGMEASCGTCNEYNIVVWKEGAGDPLCPSETYDTVEGGVYGGHVPCSCSNEHIGCGTWDMQGCTPD